MMIRTDQETYIRQMGHLTHEMTSLSLAISDVETKNVLHLIVCSSCHSLHSEIGVAACTVEQNSRNFTCIDETTSETSEGTQKVANNVL